MEQEEKLCDQLKAVREFTYLGDRINVGEGCAAAEHGVGSRSLVNVVTYYMEVGSL